MKYMGRVATFSSVGSLLLDILQYLLCLFLLYLSTGEVEPIVNIPADIHPYMLWKQKTSQNNSGIPLILVY